MQPVWQVRERATLLLAELLVRLPKLPLVPRSAARFASFFASRLADYPSVSAVILRAKKKSRVCTWLSAFGFCRAFTATPVWWENSKRRLYHDVPNHNSLRNILFWLWCDFLYQSPSSANEIQNTVQHKQAILVQPTCWLSLCPSCVDIYLAFCCLP